MSYRAHKLILVFFIFLFAISEFAYSNEIKDVAKVQPQKEPTIEDAREVLATYHKNRLNINRSMEITNEVLERDPNNVDALIFLSRVWLTRGYVGERTKEARISSFETGKEIAERAIEISPDNPDAHFFYVANLALVGQTKGIFNSLFMLPEVKKRLDTLLELDPNHTYGLGMQGTLYYYLPSILGGDMKISEIYLRRALFNDPHLSSAKLYLAMNLKKQKRYDEAVQVLEEIIREKEPTFYPDWYLNKNYAVILRSQIQKENK